MTVGRPNPRYGWRYDENNKLVPAPEELAAIQVAVEMFHQGHTMEHIARYLSAHRYRCRGVLWRAETLKTIIKRRMAEIAENVAQQERDKAQRRAERYAQQAESKRLGGPGTH